MAQIIDATLTISHDHAKKQATPVVKCKVKFSGLDLCMMGQCSKEHYFKLKCELWGEDPAVDNKLWTYGVVFYFPDASPTELEERTFTETLGEGVLNEDIASGDEIYGKLILSNLLTGTSGSVTTNVVHHHF